MSCKQCGGVTGNKFCSDQCRYAWHNSQRPTKDPQTKTCQHCAGHFLANRSDALYCSARCRQAARRA